MKHLGKSFDFASPVPILMVSMTVPWHTNDGVLSAPVKDRDMELWD